MNQFSDTPKSADQQSQQTHKFTLQALESMRKKLLDLTSRNRLLNFPITQKTSSLRVIDELPDQIYEHLLSDKLLKFCPVPNPTQKQLIEHGYLYRNAETEELEELKPMPNAKEWATQLNLDTSYELPIPSSGETEEKHNDDLIQVLLFPAEMESRLRSIANKSRTAIEETGASILYLTIGFLEWFESNDSSKSRLAPLFTIPVNIQRGNLDTNAGVYQYSIEYTGEDVLTNLSLREKLAHDYSIVLPEIEPEVTPESYLKQIEELISRVQPRWTVKRQAALSLLNFGKMLMYLDLDPSQWPEGDLNIVNHEIIKRFFVSSEKNSSTSGYDSAEEYFIDDLDQQIHQHYPLIFDADSSQHSALIDSLNGDNLVIEGPPGTGKSQTITNLIAAALSQGKKVLFVAEKMAALEVVKSRLDKAGLGDFCLELHSHNSQKSKVLSDIDARIKSQRTLSAKVNIDDEIARYEQLKNELNSYALEINNEWSSTGLSIHEILSGASLYRKRISPFLKDLDIDVSTELNNLKRLELLDQVREFCEVYGEIESQIGKDTNITHHPWYGLNDTSLQIFEIDSVIELLKQWNEKLEALELQVNLFTTQIPNHPSVELTSEIETLCDDLGSLPELEGNEKIDTLSSLNDYLVRETETALDCVDKITCTINNLREQVKIESLLTDDCQVLIPSELNNFSEAIGADKKKSLSEIIDKTREIKLIEEKLTFSYNNLTDFRNALPENLKKTINTSINGLKELSKLLRLISQLPSDLVQHRSPAYDDESIDEVINSLKDQVSILKPLDDELSDKFRLEKLLEISSSDLDLLRVELSQKSLFKWFSKEYRSKLKTFKSICREKFHSGLLTYLDKIVWYSETYNEFNSRAYGNYFGALFNSIETDVSKIETLRRWYISVREAYGIGFGKTVQLGDDLIGLSAPIFRGVEALNFENNLSQIEKSLSSLNIVQSFFDGMKERLSLNEELLGEDGALICEYEELSSSISVVQECLQSTDSSIEDISNIHDSLIQLKQSYEELALFKELGTTFNTQAAELLNQDLITKNKIRSIHSTIALYKQITRNLDSTWLIEHLLNISDAIAYENIKTSGTELVSTWSDYEQKLSDITEKTDLNYHQWTLYTEQNTHKIAEKNSIAIDSPDWLNGWVNFIRVSEQMFEKGLHSIWEAVNSRTLGIEHAEDALNFTIYSKLSRDVIDSKPHLARIAGSQLRARQKTFQEYDRKLLSLQRAKIASLISKHSAPKGISGGRKSEYTEMSLIQNELGKKNRHIPIRQLIKRAPKSLIELKPCFMMGPMSVAQYLEPGRIEFDLIVMDEASQVKPEDALGVIARGKQLVVVGDPKQLPPTSFFDRQDLDDNDDSAAVEQNDSILDAALPLFKMRRLRWHYRSQHESLIAFSNYHFYDNDLVIFPSPNSKSKEFGINFSYIKSGKFLNSCNIEESRVVAKAVVKHAIDHPNESLGVVSMNANQREQIERAVEEECKSNSKAAEAVDKLRQMGEPLFVKNLENVQGDERDVIFISFTYGPAEVGGPVYQRFGPINSDVGWRRLNVLFTRSKKRMHIFSSFKDSDVVISEHSKRGVIALKNFLHYAENGNLSSWRETGRSPDSNFEVAVIESLEKSGFQCEPQLGVNGFFIDIAVKDPGSPGKYLMGIECDGASYHSAKSARDRDRLRQEILETLGWKIRRIWSTDWYSNPHGELDPIIRELHALKTEPAAEPTAPPVSENIEDDFELVSPASQYDLFSFKREPQDDIVLSLKEKLEQINDQIIKPKFKDTPSNKRLLRASMIEALLEFEPISRSEFSELIPFYLREATSAEEAKEFLDIVLETISSDLESN